MVTCGPNVIGCHFSLFLLFRAFCLPSVITVYLQGERLGETSSEAIDRGSGTSIEPTAFHPRFCASQTHFRVHAYLRKQLIDCARPAVGSVLFFFTFVFLIMRSHALPPIDQRLLLRSAPKGPMDYTRLLLVVSTHTNTPTHQRTYQRSHILIYRFYTFAGPLFIRYETISDTVVGILQRAKNRFGVVTFEGEMLFQVVTVNLTCAARGKNVDRPEVYKLFYCYVISYFSLVPSTITYLRTTSTKLSRRLPIRAIVTMW